MDAKVARTRGPDTPMEAVFFRGLAEVYLLIDHISSQPDKLLPAQLDADRDGKADCRDWIARICEIAWPSEADPQAIDDEAEFLITTRDALNRVASPATGAMIAFTRLVADGDLASAPDPPGAEGAGQGGGSADVTGPAPRRWGSAPAGSILARQRRPVRDSLTGLTRVDLAAQAFPELEEPARRFALFYRRLIFGMIVALVLVLLLSWYVAMGDSLMRQVHAARVSCQAPQASAVATSAPTRDDPGAPPAAGAAPKPAPKPSTQFLCSRYAAAQTNMAVWTSPWSALSLAPGRGAAQAASDRLANSSPEDIGPGLWGAALVNLLGNKVLPPCYGLLGAWAAVLRGLAGRIEKNTLARRDRMTSLVKLALGAVIGACIGLFVAPSDGGGVDSPGLLGTATISFSALSFLAGYGVEHIFPLLDGLLERLFASPDPAKKTA